MLSRLSPRFVLLAIVACLIGVGATALIADVPADYKGKPFKGKMQTIPGKLILAYYDEGGEGVGYHNKDKKNHGSGELNRGPEEKNNFRKNEGISISYTKSGFDKWMDEMVDGKKVVGKKLPVDDYYVGWTAQGESLNYTVDVQKAGTYTLNVPASSYNDDKNKKNDMELSLSVDGDKKCALKLAETTNYHHWKMNNNVAEIKLEKGVHLLKMTIEKEQHAGNLMYIDFVEKTAAKAEKK